MEVVLVTQDIGLRVRCDSLGLPAEAYLGGRVCGENQYSGWTKLDVSSDAIDEFYRTKQYVCQPELIAEANVKPNTYHLLTAGNQSALARYDELSGALLPLYCNTPFQGKREGPLLWNIQPRNMGQQFAVDALLNPDIHLVTLTGKAGSGKTLLALAAGLYLTSEESMYSRVLAARPIFPMGRDLGYLPGDISEKLGPWMQPIYDNADLLLNSVTDEGGRRKKGYQELIDLGILEIEPLTYVRGRSIPQQYLIVDEAQNLSVHEIKTIITRAGEGTKIVLTGDPDQIDNPMLDRSSNGLTYATEKFKNYRLAAHITLDKGERSELASLAAEIL